MEMCRESASWMRIEEAPRWRSCSRLTGQDSGRACRLAGACAYDACNEQVSAASIWFRPAIGTLLGVDRPVEVQSAVHSKSFLTEGRKGREPSR